MARFHATVDGQIPFTAEEEVEWDAMEAAKEKHKADTAYSISRSRKYPPVGDQLDALWKGGDAAASMLLQIQAIKATYPKPE